MQMVHICKEFGWTYQEYLAQPIWFIKLIREKMIIDNKELEMQQKKLNKNNG